MLPDGLFLCPDSGRLQAAQEVQNALLVEFWELIELGNDLIGFRGRCP